MFPTSRLWLGRPRRKTNPPRRLGVLLLEPRATALSNKNFDSTEPAKRRLTNRVTLGITAQSSSRDLIDKGVYDLDVGSGHPDGAAVIKGSFVQRLKSYVIWVQTGVIQVGFYLWCAFSQYERTGKRGPLLQVCPSPILWKHLNKIRGHNPLVIKNDLLAWQNPAIAKDLSSF